MQKLTRKERRALRHIHAPHGPSSSRAIIKTKTDALRAAIYQDFDDRTRQQCRTAFAHFLNEQFDIPMPTAYGKLYNWRIEEWEAYGLVGIITQYCRENDINPPQWPSSNNNSTHSNVDVNGLWQNAIIEWLNAIPAKMKFYYYLRDRGMCRTFFRRIINGKTTITTLQLVGMITAFQRWTEQEMQRNFHLFTN